MLRLEKIELRGFKSFCDPTELVFPDAITAIVGPNGCGKSNIADAIAWVLGEQSARLLRGTRMEDVIFQGTRTRPPLGMAEVTLTLVATQEIRLRSEEEGEEGVLDEDAHQVVRRSWPVEVIPAGAVVTVARRLYRSGESEYMIDGQPVRLRDIYDLFAGTGLGPGHYALIGQDRVTALIHAKPSERRAVIEEAAGITRLKLRERSAEIRLESARQNLARLNDVIAEIERQVGTLKRQAARARRYRRLREEWRALLRQLFRLEYRRVESALAAVSERIATLERACAELMAEKAALEAEHWRFVQGERACEAHIASAREHLAQIEIELERVRGQRQYCASQLDDIAMRERALQSEEGEVTPRLALISAELSRLSGELERILGEIAEHEEEMRAEERRYEQQLAEVSAREQRIEQMRALYVEAIGSVAQWRNAGQQLLEGMRRLEAQLRRLETERERAAAQEAYLLAERERLLQELDAQHHHLEALRAERDAVAYRLEQARQEDARMRAIGVEIEKAAIAVENRLASLVELDERQAYASQAVQQLFEMSRQDGHLRLMGTLADVLRVAPDDERMVEGFLGERLHAILVPSWEDARSALALLESAQAGRAHFLVIEDGASPEEEEPTDRAPHAISGSRGDPDGQKRSDDGTECRDFLSALGTTPAVVRALARAFPECERVEIARDLEAAIRQSAEDPKRVFLTPRGEWVRGGTLLVGGGGGERLVSVLAVKREIRELRVRREELAEQLDAVRRKQEECERAVRTWLQESERVGTTLQEHERARHESEGRLSEIEQDLARVRQHLAVIAFEHSEVERERARLEQEYAHARAEQEKAAERLRALEVEQQEQRAALAEQRRICDASAERGAALRIQLAAKAEKRQALHAQVRRLEQERQTALRRLDALRLERERLRHEQQRCREQCHALEQRERELEAARQQAEADVHRAAEELSRAHIAVDSLSARLEDLRRRESELRERLRQDEIERAELLAEMRHVSESCWTELGERVEDVLAASGEGETSGAPGSREAISSEERGDSGPPRDLVIAWGAREDPQAVRARLDEVRRKIEELGPVNLMALEELSEVEQRLVFLRAQREDVERSIATTEEALREIRRRARHRFLAAFDAINAHFEDVFRELFGGGRGQMLLLDPENVLESGIEILAQPPGKRLQNLHLLSGGEKALTALALLLAIFRYRPSPFCVLDEVDAPLDDMNVVRFSRQIVQMSQQTQFILITHNKGTMEVADILYGVTMEEPGVSKVVSVRLQ